MQSSAKFVRVHGNSKIVLVLVVVLVLEDVSAERLINVSHDLTDALWYRFDFGGIKRPFEDEDDDE